MKFKEKFFMGKSRSFSGRIKGTLILFMPVIIIISIFLYSCCIDYSKFLEPVSKEIIFTEGGENADEIDELLDKYNLDAEDFADSGDSSHKEVDYTEIKRELANASNYPIIPEEEENFFRNLKGIYSEERFILVKDYLEKFRHLYPSGYFIMIKVTGKSGYSLFELMEERRKNMPDSISKIMGYDFNLNYSGNVSTIIHELTHMGPMAYLDILAENGLSIEYGNGSYLTGNLIVLIEKDKVLFSKSEIFKDIKNPDNFDILYLDPGEPAHKVDFINILDEINAYTVSAKCDIATEEFIKDSCTQSTRRGLLKQMSHLELYLKRCYQKHPEDWKYITENKGLAFLIMKLWYEAEKYEDALKDDTRFNNESQPVSEFVYNMDNYWIIKKYFDDSRILSYKDKTFPEAAGELEEIKIFDLSL